MLVAPQDLTAAEVNEAVLALPLVQQLSERVQPKILVIGQPNTAWTAMGSKVEHGSGLASSLPFMVKIVFKLGIIYNP